MLFVFWCNQDFDEFVVAAGIDQKASMYFVLEIFLNQPRIAKKLGFVGVIDDAVVLGKLVIQRRHSAVFQQQNFIYFAPQKLVCQILGLILFHSANALAQVLFCFASNGCCVVRAREGLWNIVPHFVAHAIPAQSR